MVPAPSLRVLLESGKLTVMHVHLEGCDVKTIFGAPGTLAGCGTARLRQPKAMSKGSLRPPAYRAKPPQTWTALYKARALKSAPRR